MNPSTLGMSYQFETIVSLPHDCANHSVKIKLGIDKDANNHKGWRRIVLNFTPSWFSLTMGTGIVAILLHNLPFNAQWLYWISVVLFLLNICLFILCTIISVIRYIMFPGLWNTMLRHPVQSLFLGTIPMGLATIINLTVFILVPAYPTHTWPATLCWSLWWFDVVLSIICCTYLPFIIMSLHASHISTMTAAWLLPIVPTIVAAASGGIVANILPDAQHALWTLITSYILWGAGVPLAMCVLVIYFHRLMMHSLPPREVIVSVFLPLGPLGQGGFAAMQLGKVAMEVIPKTGTLVVGAGQILYVFGFVVALIMWGFGVVWLVFAIASITRSKFPFNMGWWGFTFPLGVFTVSTTAIGKELPSMVFRVLGTIFSILVVILWLIVSARTVEKSVQGTLFFAPCVTEYETQRTKRKQEQKVTAKIDSIAV